MKLPHSKRESGYQYITTAAERAAARPKQEGDELFVPARLTMGKEVAPAHWEPADPHMPFCPTFVYRRKLT